MAPSGSTSIPTLTNCDDVIDLAMDCGSDIDKVSHILLPALNKVCTTHHGRGQETLLHGAQGETEPLDILNPQDHTLAYAFILATRASNSIEWPEASQALLPYISAFTSRFNPQQAHLANVKIHELALAIVTIASKQEEGLSWGLDTLRALFHRYTDTIPAQLTTLHPLLVSYCIRTNQPRLAHDWVLNRPVVDASKRFSPIRATDVIDYFFLGGSAYLELSDWDAAESFFEQCIAVPAHCAHDRQVQASKRLILVQLARDGEAAPLPSYVSPSVVRNLQRFTHAYSQLADLYASKDRTVTESRLDDMVDRHRETFETDGNIPLIRFLLASHRVRRIQRLRNSFTRLSIRDVVAVLDLSELGEDAVVAEQRVGAYIESLISSGQLQATLSPHDPSPILTFGPPSSSRSSVNGDSQTTFASLEGIATLSKQMQALQQWNSHLEQKEREIARSRRYIAKQQSASNGMGVGGRGMGASGWGGGAGGGGSVVMGEDDFNEDIFA